MTSRKVFAGVVVAVAGAIAAMPGCVDQDPIVTGHRADAGPNSPDANTPDVVTPEIINTVVPLEDYADGGDADDPRCRHCATTLDTSKPRGTLCRYNNGGGSGKSSSQLLNGVVACVCYDKCGSKCGNYCSGGKNDLICSSCITQNCPDQISACQTDIPEDG